MKKKSFNDKFGLTSAVLSGGKTMFRETLKCGEILTARHWNPKLQMPHCYFKGCQLIDDDRKKIVKPKYKIGEVIAIAHSYEEAIKSYSTDSSFYHLIKKECDVNHSKGRHNKMFVKSILMPHQIKITNIRIERLQDISDEDCLREGIRHVSWDSFDLDGHPVKREFFYFEDNYSPYKTHRDAYAALIDKTNGKGTWESNPYVFVYEFELIK